MTLLSHVYRLWAMTAFHWVIEMFNVTHHLDHNQLQDGGHSNKTPATVPKLLPQPQDRTYRNRMVATVTRPANHTALSYALYLTSVLSIVREYPAIQCPIRPWMSCSSMNVIFRP